MRATICATVALGALAGAASLGCENTASDCAKLGTVCTGGGGTGGGGAGGGGNGGGGNGGGGGGMGGGGMGGGGMGGATTSSTTTKPCDVLELKSFGDVADQAASAFLVTPTKDVAIAGSFFGNLQFGMSAITAPGPGPSYFVAPLDKDALGPYSPRTLDAHVFGSAYDASGTLVVVGVDWKEMGLDCGGVIATAGATDLFLLALSTDGTCQFFRSFAATNVTTASVAVGAAGEIVIAGGFEGDLALDDSQDPPAVLTSVGGRDIFVARRTAGGAHSWAGAYGDVDQDEATAVVVHSDGKVVVAGTHTSELDFKDGGEVLDSGAQPAPFVVAFNGNGTVPWARSFKVDVGTQRVFGLALDTSDADGATVVLSGDLEGVVDGAALLPAVPGDTTLVLKEENHGLFLARFGLAGDGKLISNSVYSGSGNMAVGATVVDAGGRILLAGWLDGALTFAEETGVLAVQGAGARGFVAVLGGDLVHLKSEALGAAEAGGESRTLAATFVDQGLLVAGSFSGGLTIGPEAATSKGGDDIFIARLCAE